MEWIDWEIFHFGKYSLKVSNVIALLIVVIATIVVIAIFKRIIEHPRFKGDKTEERRRHSIFLLIKYFLLVISVIAGIEALGFKVQIILAGSAALLVGIGLGLQSIFSDFMSGIFLLVEGTIKVGEIIEVDGIIGRVEEINLRNSQILTRDNVVVIVPNSKFVTEKVINWSANHDSVRFFLDIGVAYGSDARIVETILKKCMDGMNSIENEPAPYVRFKEFGDSSINFELVFWSQQSFRIDNVKSDLRFRIYDSLKENGISIPFPQRDIHIKTNS